MKRVFLLFALMACLFWIAGPVQAGTMTITFDEYGPLNGTCLTEEYADSGVHFVPTLQGACDASTYDTPWRGITGGTNGAQIMGSDGAVESNGSKSAGFVIEFDFDVDSVQIDLAVSPETTTTEPMTYMMLRGNVFAGFGNTALPGPGGWTTITMAPNNGTFTALVVYVPAGNDEDGYTEAILGFDNLVINGDVPCPPPSADFAAMPGSGYAPLTVDFIDESSGSIVSWAWTFGDGATSSDQNPSHTYNSATSETFEACLTVTNDCGETDTVCMDISVEPQPCDPPTACFTADPESGQAPLTVDFTDCSVDAVAWAWTFGDGATSSDQNPFYSYDAGGTFEVCLTVTNDCGAVDMVCSEIVVDDPVTCDPIEVDFEGTPVVGMAPLTVEFSDLSNGAVWWRWTFGDSTNSQEANPTHTYTEPGSYGVYLLVYNACGENDWVYKADYITAEACEPSVPAFTADPTSGYAPLTVEFTDQSTEYPTAWSWDFGDGNVSSDQNPTNTYASPGVYSVTLTVTNCDGSAAIVEDDLITVEESVDNIHVNEVTVVQESFPAWWMYVRGKANVQIVDHTGVPVANATVSGQWSGDANDSDTFSTDGEGWGTCTSSWKWKKWVGNTFTFCVTDVVLPDWPYNPGANVETCDTAE